MLHVLVACEASARVRDAFIAAGHDAWSCDIKPTLGRAGNHLMGDVRHALDGNLHRFPDAIDIRTGRQPMFRKWDLMIGFPECTYLASSGLHHNLRVPGRAEKTEAALAFFELLWSADIPRICLENPKGCISTRVLDTPDLFDGSISPISRKKAGLKPTQRIQPYEFGEDASKETFLFLKGLPKLKPTVRFHGRLVEWPPGSGKMVERFSNQTDGGQNNVPDSKNQAALRGYTYPGIANAMAAQWGRLHG